MTEGEIQQPRERHLGLIITLILILIACVGVILYLLNLLPAQIADMVIKPTEKMTQSGARFVTNTVNSVADLGASKKAGPMSRFLRLWPIMCGASMLMSFLELNLTRTENRCILSTV